MRLKIWMMMISAVSLTAGCLAPSHEGALFSDVSRRPPAAAPETISALKRDRAFGEWVLYQADACDEFGCQE